jgi:hypothetical protein
MRTDRPPASPSAAPTVLAVVGLALLVLAACAPRLEPPRSPGPPVLGARVPPVHCNTYDYEGQGYAMCFPTNLPAFLISTPGVPTMPAAVQTAILLTETARPFAGTPRPAR